MELQRERWLELHGEISVFLSVHLGEIEMVTDQIFLYIFNMSNLDEKMAIIPNIIH